MSASEPRAKNPSLKEIAERSVQNHGRLDRSSAPPSSRSSPHNAELLASFAARSSRTALLERPISVEPTLGTSPGRPLWVSVPEGAPTVDVSDCPDIMLSPPQATHAIPALTPPLTNAPKHAAPTLADPTFFSSGRHGLGASTMNHAHSASAIHHRVPRGVGRWLLVGVWLLLLVGVAALGLVVRRPSSSPASAPALGNATHSP